MAIEVVVPSAEARAKLSSYLKSFRSKESKAEPVVFGSHRKPEAVLLSYQRYRELLETLDDLAIGEEVRAALAEDSGARVELADVAAEIGIDPKDLGL